MEQHHDDFHVEPVRGLPEAPPQGEHIIWQGAPSWWALSRDALAVKWVAGYFVLLAAWRGTVIAGEGGAAMGFKATVPYLAMGAVACLILMGVAWVMAKATVYTITNRRLALRIGAALTVTLNIPFTLLASADLTRRKDGSGTIALELLDDTRLSYLICWPHVRPWTLSKCQPALRSLPKVDEVAKILADAAKTRVEEHQQDLRTHAAQIPAE